MGGVMGDPSYYVDQTPKHLLSDPEGKIQKAKFQMDDGELEEVIIDPINGPRIVAFQGTTTHMKSWPCLTATEREIALVTAAKKNHYNNWAVKEKWRRAGARKKIWNY